MKNERTEEGGGYSKNEHERTRGRGSKFGKSGRTYFLNGPLNPPPEKISQLLAYIGESLDDILS